MPDNTEPQTRPATWTVLQQRAPRVLLTALVAIAGGLAFNLLGIPAAWLSGPAAGVAIAVLAGLKADVPANLRIVALFVLGAMMGASVTPDTLAQLARTPLTVAGLVLSLSAVMGGIALYLRFVHRFDMLTAQLAAAPGASMYVLALAIEARADVKKVAIIQMLRLVALIILLPSVFAMFGFVGSVSASPVALRPVDWTELAILAVVAVAVGVAFEWWRVPTGVMFGAMVAGGYCSGRGRSRPVCRTGSCCRASSSSVPSLAAIFRASQCRNWRGR